MKDHITKTHLKVEHLTPKSPQPSPHKHITIHYGQEVQNSTMGPNSPWLDSNGIQKFQTIFNSLPYYSRAVDNKLLVSPSELGQKQAPSTEATNYEIEQLLDRVVAYPNDRITYRTINMILTMHSDTTYLNVS